MDKIITIELTPRSDGTLLELAGEDGHTVGTFLLSDEAADELPVISTLARWVGRHTSDEIKQSDLAGITAMVRHRIESVIIDIERR